MKIKRIRAGTAALAVAASLAAAGCAGVATPPLKQWQLDEITPSTYRKVDREADIAIEGKIRSLQRRGIVHPRTHDIGRLRRDLKAKWAEKRDHVAHYLQTNGPNYLCEVGSYVTASDVNYRITCGWQRLVRSSLFLGRFSWNYRLRSE